MPMMGAFLGGKGSSIASGYSMLDLTWITNDGQNMANVQITLTGPQNYTVTTDANGHVLATVVVGTYVAHVNYSGNYTGAEDKTVMANNREVTTVIWLAQRIVKYNVTFKSPSDFSSVTYNISGETGQKYSGTSWTKNMSFSLEDYDSYTLTLTIFGDTISHDFVVNSDMTIDLSSYFCAVTVTNPTGLSVSSPQYNGYSVSFPGTFYVLRTSSSRTIKATCASKYSGESTVALATFSNKTITPSSGSVSVELTAVGAVVTITSAGTLTIPVSAKYHILLIGGGAGGGRGDANSSMSAPADGGNSGQVIDEPSYSVGMGSYKIVIGAGGAGATPDSSSTAGGATSFGTLLSASGGSPNSGGGAGGGGGGGYRGSNKGIAGLYSGGGGCGGGSRADPSKVGGAGGPYGGSGGGRSASNRYEPVAGGNGTAVSSGSIYYGDSASSPATGGSAGAGTSSSACGGSGGGGGRGANGGKGGDYGSGGGGGGIAGGNGGDGGSNGSRTTAVVGKGGTGYGAGGGGGSCGYSGSSTTFGGGGGAGGLGTTKVAGDGTNTFAWNSSGSYYYSTGGDGAPGAIRIQWVSS